jgi:hypothetical protein
MNEVLLEEPVLPQPTDSCCHLQIQVSSTSSAFIMVLQKKFEE